MTIKALEIMKTAFEACVSWTTQLLSATGGDGVIMAAFCVVLTVTLLFIPMRGNAITNIDLYAKNVIHKKNKQKAKSQGKSIKKGD